MKYLIFLMVFFSLGFAFGQDDDDKPSTNQGIAHDRCKDKDDDEYKQCMEEQKEVLSIFDDDDDEESPFCDTDEYEEIRDGCKKLGFDPGKECFSKLKGCEDCNTGREPRGFSRTKCRSTCNRVLSIAREDEAKDALDKVRDELEDSEDNLLDMQEDLTDLQNESIKEKQSIEQQIQEKQQELSAIPQKANQIALEAKDAKQKAAFDHVDALNDAMDRLTELNNKITDAENALVAERNKLLDQCEAKARGIQKKKTEINNQRKMARRNNYSSLNQAMQTTKNTSCKKANTNNRAECEIIKNFQQCQKTRTYQTGLNQAKRSYKRTLQQIESQKASTERRVQTLEAKLQYTMKRNQEIQQMKISQLAQEQQNIANSIMQLQQQKQENFQKAQMQMQQKEQQIMQAQMQQNVLMHTREPREIARFRNSYDDDDYENIQSALSFVNGIDADEDDIEDDFDEVLTNSDELKAFKSCEGNRYRIQGDGTGG